MIAVDFGLIHSVWTVIAFVLFVAIAIWAFSSRNRKRFDDMSRMPLEDGDNKISSSERENSHG